MGLMDDAPSHHCRWMHGWWADLDKAWKAKPELRIFRFDALPAHRKGDGSHDGPAASELGDLCAREDALECVAHRARSRGARSLGARVPGAGAVEHGAPCRWDSDPHMAGTAFPIWQVGLGRAANADSRCGA